MLISLTAAALLISLADQDGVISTAPRTPVALPSAQASDIQSASPSTTVGSATPHGLSTSEQINNWIGQSRAERPASELPWDRPSYEEAEPRKPTGEISAGIGTGGYRDFSAAVQLPVGESGTLSLAVRQSKNDPYAYDPYYGRDGVFGLHDLHRGPHGPLSHNMSYGAGAFYMPERTGWVRERLTSDPYGSPTGGKSTSLSIGFDSSTSD